MQRRETRQREKARERLILTTPASSVSPTSEPPHTRDIVRPRAAVRQQASEAARYRLIEDRYNNTAHGPGNALGMRCLTDARCRPCALEGARGCMSDRIARKRKKIEEAPSAAPQNAPRM